MRTRNREITQLQLLDEPEPHTLPELCDVFFAIGHQL